MIFKIRSTSIRKGGCQARSMNPYPKKSSKLKNNPVLEFNAISSGVTKCSTNSAATSPRDFSANSAGVTESSVNSMSTNSGSRENMELFAKSSSSSTANPWSDASTSHSRVGSISMRSDGSDSSSSSVKPHSSGDSRWEAIQLAKARESPIGPSLFRPLKLLGVGDIGSVHLVELIGTNTFFAVKVMNKASLVNRKKLPRANTEIEILRVLDHPFLPTLYSEFDTGEFCSVVMEFCSGGDLLSLREKQPNKHFSEQAARFYASEVLVALEYLHMLGIVYRDLKPENVLIREEGHIMLSDFDLSLRSSTSPTLVKSSSVRSSAAGSLLKNGCRAPGCIQPSALIPKFLRKKNRKPKLDLGLFAGDSLPELMAEPANARSMSFVGTHEYLAPEIIRGGGHGSAVDWWTFGIFLYELLHGTTPFKGNGIRATLFNAVAQPLRFPNFPDVSPEAQDLIRGLLERDPEQRIGYKRGATEIKQHPFFKGVNWVNIRGTTPPHVPDPADFTQDASKEASQKKKKVTESNGGGDETGSEDSSSHDFEFF